MSEIYLIRHTTPAVAKGVCYGQTDLDTTDSLHEEADIIRQHLPVVVGAVHSSPLRRCSQLAGLLFPGYPIAYHDELMEIHCGQWEMKKWDDLPPEEVGPWMKDFVQVRIPGGESYLDLHERVTECFNRIRTADAAGPGPVADAGAADARTPVPDPALLRSAAPAKMIVAHGGVIRSILSYITGTPLIDSFKVFSLHYGCVIRLFGEPDALQYEILFNRAPEEREQHKPRNFYDGAGV